MVETKLLEKYGSSLHLTSGGYRSIMTLKDSLGSIINDKWYKERNENLEDEKERILLTAAR